MKLLFFEWGSYLYYDIIDTMKRAGHTVRTVSYKFSDFDNDDYFMTRFSGFLADGYDAVFSVNYFPLVAKCCHDSGTVYIGWSSDCPLQVSNAEDTLGLDTNRIFFFDADQYAHFRKMGFENVYHMPLAVNIPRISGLVTGSAEQSRFGADVSMVGNLYETTLAEFIALMDDYHKGYMQSIIDTQSKLYGCDLLGNMITGEFASSLEEYYLSCGISLSDHITADFLRTQTAKFITHRERILLLKLLSNHYRTNLYSVRTDPVLDKVKFLGTVDYRNEMNHVFRCSKINLNITLRSITSGIPQRALDIMGAGGFLLSNYQPELAEYFEDGRELAMYESVEHAFELSKYYLSHDDERAAIARTGAERIAADFSYEKQLGEILRTAL